MRAILMFNNCEGYASSLVGGRGGVGGVGPGMGAGRGGGQWTLGFDSP